MRDIGKGADKQDSETAHESVVTGSTETIIRHEANETGPSLKCIIQRLRRELSCAAAPVDRSKAIVIHLYGFVLPTTSHHY